MDEFLKTICGVFALEGVYLGNEVIKCGNINDTYRMDLRTDSGLKSYIVQRINHNVFRHPERIISNVCAVTEHIAKSWSRRMTRDIDARCSSSTSLPRASIFIFRRTETTGV